MTPEKLKNQLNKFTPRDCYWSRHAYGTVDFSPGIQFLLDNTNFQPLLDLIGDTVESPEWEEAIEQDEDIFANSFWCIYINNHNILLEWKEDPEKPAAITHILENKSFPFDFMLYMTCYPGKVAKLFLPSEDEH